MRNFSEQATSALPQTIGQATILQQPQKGALDYLQDAQRYKADQDAKLRAQRDKEVQDKLKYAPDAIWHPFTQEHNTGVEDLLNYRSGLINKGTPLSYGSPEFTEFEKKKFALQQNVSKAEDIKKNYYEIVDNKQPYTNKNVVFSKLNDYVIGGPDKRKNVNDIEVNDMYSVLSDPDTLNATDLTQDFVKSIPEAVGQIVKTRGINVGADKGVYFDEIKEQSKFYTQGPDGKLTINITPETTALFKGMDQRVEPFIQKQLSLPENKGKSEDDIIRELITPFAYANKIVNRSGISKESKGSGSGDEDENANEDVFNTEENYNLNKKGGTDREVVKSWAPHEIRIGQKETDTPVFINAQTLIDPNTNSTFRDASGKPIVGDQKVSVTRVRLMPFDEESGRILPGTKSEIEEYKKKKPVGYKWMAGGIMHSTNEDGDKVEKAVLIPYDEVKIDLDKKKKLNLDNRPPSKYSDEELKYFIKKSFPNLTAEQKAKKFMEYRNSK